jgi:hypothetical protein
LKGRDIVLVLSWILKELNSNKSMESVIRYSIW